MKRGPRSALATRASTLVLSLVVAGCTREIAAGLDESEANRGVVALARSGIDAEKAADPTVEGHYRLVVSRDEATAAIAVLAGEELPRVHAAPQKDASFVASAEADRAARIAATAAQVERTLGSIDGVLDARVLLDVPSVDALSVALAPQGSTPIKASASVLIRHRGSNPPVPLDDVRRLVAGAVSGMAPGDVAVVLVAVPLPSISADRQIAWLGPVGVARASMSTVRVVAVGLFVLVAALAALVFVLAVRLRRRAEPVEPGSAPLAAKAAR
ncbi:MAG: hypothetical protein NVS3B10_10590 [Polyangiales bacterium]